MTILPKAIYQRVVMQICLDIIKTSSTIDPNILVPWVKDKLLEHGISCTKE